MSNTLLPCPFCGGEAIVVKTKRCGRYIGCWDCGGRTEEFETDYAGSAHAKAIAAWNHRAEDGNPPLTLEELRQMDENYYNIANERIQKALVEKEVQND